MAGGGGSVLKLTTKFRETFHNVLVERVNMGSPPSMRTIVRKVYHIDGWAALRIFADQTVRPSLNIVKTFAIFVDSFSGGGGRVKL